MATIAPREHTLKSGETVLIRSGAPQDAAATRTLALSVIREREYSITEADEFVADEDQEREWIRGFIEHPDALLLVAEVNGALAGLLDFRAESRRRLAHTGAFGISVAAAWREQGVGSAMIRTLLDWARVHPRIEKVCLGVLGHNHRAIHVYHKLGFIEEGRRPRQIKLDAGRYVDEVLMYQFVKEPAGER